MNRGGAGARSLNIELQAALNPVAGDRKVERFGWIFAPSDKVMQIENDYDKEVYNGDIGYVDDVNPQDNELIANFLTADRSPVSKRTAQWAMICELVAAAACRVIAWPSVPPAPPPT